MGIGLGALIGAGAGALGGVFGSAGRNKAIREQMQLLAQRQQENQNWFDRRYNEDATQRADAQRMLQITENNIRKRNKAAAGREAIMGGPTEATAREKEAGNQMYADAVSQINAAGERRKDQIEQQYLQQKNALDQQQMALEGQKQNGFDVANNIIGGAAQGFQMGSEFDKKG
jgi:hypothetical protein